MIEFRCPSLEYYCKLLKFDVGVFVNLERRMISFYLNLAVPAATLVTEDIKFTLLGIYEIPNLNAAFFYALDN